MTGEVSVRALEWPPDVLGEFFTPPLVEGAGVWLTKFTLWLWVSVALIIIFFLIAYRDPKLVPSRLQWMAESVYGFGRDNVSKELIGHEGIKFAPYITTLFCFVLLNNLFGIIPGIQVSPMAHIAFPATLAVLSYLLFNIVGIRRHGFVKYVKHALMPPAPWYVLPILVPIEFLSTFLLRPFTLAVRLFANMFAGHVILLVFTLGGFALLNAESLFLKPVSLLSWLLAVALTFLEVLVSLLQAYIFVVLTASYVQGALAEEH